MANGSLNFSVVFSAVTQAFNSGVKGAAQNYQQAVSGISSSSDEVGRVTQALAGKLQEVFKAGNAKDIVTSFKAVTQELNNAKNGATLTASEMSAIGRAGKTATAELTAALKTAQAELKALQQAKAAPADLLTAKTKVAELRTELAQAGAEYSRVQSAATAAMRRAAADTQSVGEASRAAGQAIYGMLNIKSSGQLRTEIASINQQLEAFKRNSGAPAQEVARVTAAAQAQIAGLRAQVTGTTPQMTTLASSIRAIGPAAAVFTGVTLGLSSVKEGVEAVIAATLRYEATMKQLEFATGSIGKAAQEYGFLVDTSKRLGLELQSSADGYAKLSAATKGTVIEGDKTRLVFEGVASAAATMNLTGAETNGMFVALAQMLGKGKVTAEEWRGQFAERMPAAAAVMQKALKMSAVEFNAFIESGADAALFLEKLGPAFMDAFGPSAAKNAAGLRGQINGLKTDFELLLIQIGQGGVGQAAVAIMKDLRGAIESVQGAISGIDPANVSATKQIFEQLYTSVSSVFTTLLGAVGDAVSALRELLDGVAGVALGFDDLGGSSEQVSILTRALQGISILMGAFNDGIKAVDIAFSLALGTAQSFFSAVALGLSKITFGDLSRDLEQFAFAMQDKAQKSFETASQKAMDFKSSAVAAADAAIESHEKAGAAVTKAHVDAAGKVVEAQGEIATAAQKTSNTIQLTSAEGEKAIVGMAVANQEVIKALKDLAKESGITLPVTKLSAQQLAEVMGEVAAKSKDAATAIGKNLKDAVEGLKAKDLVVAWDGYIKGLEKAGASTELLESTTTVFATAAVKLLGGDLTMALGKVSTGFTDNITVLNNLISKMGDLKKQGVDTGVALEQAMVGMLSKAKNPTEINELITRWEDLGKRGLVTGQQMSEGLEQARKKLDEVKPGVNSVNEALRVLGQTGNDTAANLQAKYVAAFKVLKESGTATFTQLTNGLKTMLDAANDPKSLTELIRHFKDLGAQGKLASYDVKQGLSDVKNKLDDMKPGINSLSEAFRAFGMVTREESAAMADKYGQAFKVMRDSGQATAAELRSAFTKYAEAAVQANGGLVDGFVQAEAAALGLQVRVDETGKVIVEAMDSGANATDAMGMSLERAVDSYGRLGAAAQAAAEAAIAAKEKELEMQERLMDAKQKEIDLENRRLNVDKSGFSLDANGNRMSITVPTWLSTLSQLKSYGLNEDQARKIANEAFDSNGKQTSLQQYRQNSGETWGVLLARAAEQALRNTPLNTNGGGTGGGSSGGSSTPSKSPSAGTSSGVSGSGKTTTVVIDNGKTKVKTNMASEDENKFLTMLGTSRKSA